MKNLARLFALLIALSPLGALATTVESTIMASGGAYTSLTAWEAGQNGDITATGRNEEINRALVQDNFEDANFAIDGWDTDSTHKIEIIVAANNRHRGYWDTGRYRIQSADGSWAILNYENFVTIKGVQTRGDLYGIVAASTGSGAVVTIDSCLCYGTATGSVSNQMFATNGNHAAANTYWINSISIAYGTLANYSTGFLCNGGVCYAYSCTSGGGPYVGFRRLTGTFTAAKNCYSGGSSGFDYNGTITQTTCASEDATATGTARDNIAYTTANFTNVTAGSENLMLVSDGTDPLLNVGTDLSATFTTDIIGTTRPTGAGTWDIGAFEYIAAGAGGLPWLPILLNQEAL